MAYRCRLVQKRDGACEARYPDSGARCSLPADHHGSHCSQSHGMLWPNAETFALRKGTKVRLGRADGVVASLDRQGTPDRAAVVVLESGKEKRVVLRTAALRLASTGSGEGVAPFRLCLGCGEVVEAGTEP